MSNWGLPHVALHGNMIPDLPTQITSRCSQDDRCWCGFNVWLSCAYHTKTRSLLNKSLLKLKNKHNLGTIQERAWSRQADNGWYGICNMWCCTTCTVHVICSGSSLQQRTCCIGCTRTSAGSYPVTWASSNEAGLAATWEEYGKVWQGRVWISLGPFAADFESSREQLKRGFWFRVDKDRAGNGG